MGLGPARPAAPRGAAPTYCYLATNTATACPTSLVTPTAGSILAYPVSYRAADDSWTVAGSPTVERGGLMIVRITVTNLAAVPKKLRLRLDWGSISDITGVTAMVRAMASDGGHTTRVRESASLPRVACVCADLRADTLAWSIRTYPLFECIS